jgi:hypothetical protein
MNVLTEANGCLDEFEAGRMSLPQLVVRLEALQSVADEHSDEWRQRFFEEWMALEEINALLLDESRADKNSNFYGTTHHGRDCS